MRTKVSISYSKDDMDSWEEGRKTWFIIETPKPLDEDKLTQISRVYLHQLEVEYREFMTKEEVLDSKEEVVQWRHIINQYNPEEKLLLDEKGDILVIGEYNPNKMVYLAEGCVTGYERGTGKAVEIAVAIATHPDFKTQKYED